MNSLLKPAIAALLLASLQPLLVNPAAAATVVLDQIAVVVDEDVIMQSEIEERMRTIKAQIAASSSKAPPEDVLREQVIERLIVESLQLQMADRGGIRVSDDELNQAMAGIAAQNNMSLEQFRIALANDGVSWAQMREQVRREFAISRVQQGVMRRRIQVSEQEVQNFLASDIGQELTSDEYQLGHILLALPASPTADDIRKLRGKAQLLLESLQNGADFQSMAIEHSDGQNALAGGDMGWRKPAQLPSIFSDLVVDMNVGELQGPIKSGRGFHLIKLLNKRGAETQGQVAQTEVRHVLLTPNEIRSEREAFELANSLRDEILEGRDFAEVAKLYSDDPGSALSGGDLGWSRAGVFVPEFERTMQNTDIDEISEVFRTQHGYHFLQVTGRRVEDFSERFRMGQAENYIRNQKFDEELDSWIREIRDEAFVEFKI